MTKTLREKAISHRHHVVMLASLMLCVHIVANYMEMHGLGVGLGVTGTILIALVDA